MGYRDPILTGQPTLWHPSLRNVRVVAGIVCLRQVIRISFYGGCIDRYPSPNDVGLLNLPWKADMRPVERTAGETRSWGR
jgi:hypothetical protein